MAKYATNASGAMLLINLIQVTESISGSVVPLAMFIITTRSLGPLWGPTSSLRPFGPALGPSGLLDFVLRALRALRPCDPRMHVSVILIVDDACIHDACIHDA